MTPGRRTVALRRAAVVAVGALALAPFPAGAQGSGIAVTAGWSRALPAVARSTEFYMVIQNQGEAPDRLEAARSPACGMLETFETYQDTRGMMMMRAVSGGSLEVPPGRLELKPGGLHLMCMDRTGDLAAGSRIPVTLRFRDAGEVQVQLDVRRR